MKILLDTSVKWFKAVHIRVLNNLQLISWLLNMLKWLFWHWGICCCPRGTARLPIGFPLASIRSNLGENFTCFKKIFFLAQDLLFSCSHLNDFLKDCVRYFIFFVQMIATQKLSKMLLISSKKLFLLSRYSNFSSFFQIQNDEWKWNNLCYEMTCMN